MRMAMGMATPRNNITPCSLTLPPSESQKTLTFPCLRGRSCGRYLSAPLCHRHTLLRLRSQSMNSWPILALASSVKEPATATSGKPNSAVLEALGRVCTGPTQTRPLDHAQTLHVLSTIIQSAKGELEDKVSEAQLGAFFAAMTVRATSFPPATQWSEGEQKAMKELWPLLVEILPDDVLFLADPEGSMMDAVSMARPRFVGCGSAEMRLVGALREVLSGGHLGFEESVGLLRDILPLGGTEQSVRPSLVAAFLIAQRMNGETDRELKAYCLAFDNELGSIPIADVKSLTHYGDPYDGNTRFFRSTLFVAAIRASYGEACLMHGVDWMPPKGGVTEEQMLKHMGAAITLTPAAAAKLLEDEMVGLAYISQREASPSLYSLVNIREHIKKRPPIATTEKVQQYVRARGREAMVAGFYHAGYEDSLLMLMRRRGADAGLIVKGEEGALSLTTKERSADAPAKGFPVNYCAGFRNVGSFSKEFLEADGVCRETFSMVVNAKDYGFEPTQSPRTDRSAVKNMQLGLSALEGVKGPAYDRIILNAAIQDYLLGSRDITDIPSAIERAKDAVDSGRALSQLQNYIEATHKVL